MNMNSIIKAFAAACFISATDALEYPGDDCCMFFTSKNFIGEASIECHNGEDTASGDF